ncbi:hypothetical protein FE257_007423 [Aspergillus nanangensis]|uniref:GPI inositol-deacylase n=1 Tax=Aspergillus nanangensis TaxID=2582783 RepID=A0AAD4CML1_ASPNN|nr:hypothetical protein FE257_007423 [Aspergillus nanangensis]
MKTERLLTGSLPAVVSHCIAPQRLKIELININRPIRALSMLTPVLFVHGLGGQRRGTWTADGDDGQDVFWPEQFLAQDLPKARILIFGYDSKFLSASESVSQNRMENYAADLCSSLASARSSADTSKRPILLVAHSLGGLVCAQALVIGDRSSAGTDTHSISSCVRGMVFFGTPFRGSKAAGLSERILRIVGMFWSNTSAANVKDLTEDSETLRILRSAFPELLSKRNESPQKIHVTFFYEQLKTNRVMIVDEESATIPGQGEKISIRANHLDMCKFETREDDVYKTVVRQLEKMIAKIMNGKPSSENAPKYQIRNDRCAIGSIGDVGSQVNNFQIPQ